MKTTEITTFGQISEKDLSRKEFFDQYNLHFRDLRPVFIRKHFSLIMPRGKCIVISVKSIKMIIADDRMFLFNTQIPIIHEDFIPFLQEKIQSNKEEIIRFEHLILETTLQFVYQTFQRRFDDIERTADQILEKLGQKKVQDTTFEQLLHLKKRISTITTNLSEIEEELTEILDDEEELKEMSLGQNHTEETLDIIESILEDMLDQIEDLSHRTKEIEENIDDAQEILTLKMNHIRNMVIKFDLLLTAVAACLTTLAVVTGFYGMNVPNNFETHPHVIWYLGIGLGIFFTLSFGGLIYWMRRKNML